MVINIAKKDYEIIAEETSGLFLVMMLQATPPGSTTTPAQVLWSSTIASQLATPTMTMQLC